VYLYSGSSVWGGEGGSEAEAASPDQRLPWEVSRDFSATTQGLLASANFTSGGRGVSNIEFSAEKKLQRWLTLLHEQCPRSLNPTSTLSFVSQTLSSARAHQEDNHDSKCPLPSPSQRFLSSLKSKAALSKLNQRLPTTKAG
jgi:hypothetical protein